MLVDDSLTQTAAGQVRTRVVNEIIGLVHPCWFRLANVESDSPMSIVVDVRPAPGSVELSGVQLVGHRDATAAPASLERCMASALRAVRRRIPVPEEASRLGWFVSHEVIISRSPGICGSR
jgi:hypothetical protein